MGFHKTISNKYCSSELFIKEYWEEKKVALFTHKRNIQQQYLTLMFLEHQISILDRCLHDHEDTKALD